MIRQIKLLKMAGNAPMLFSRMHVLGCISLSLYSSPTGLFLTFMYKLICPITGHFLMISLCQKSFSISV